MDELDPLLSPGPAVPQAPVGPGDLGLPPPPDPQRYGLDELRQRALGPVQTPDNGLGRILKVIALGAASALGPGRGTGILQGVQAHGDQERLMRERDQMQAQRLYGAMQSDYEQEQAAYQREATQKQTVLQQNLTALRSAAGKAKTKAEYDQYVEAFGTGLQRMGYRLGPNWLRAQVPYVAPEMSTEAEKVLSSFFSNPMNKQTLEQHPDKLAEISVEFDRDGDGQPELVTLPELAKIAKRPFGVGPDGKLLVYAKGTTSDVKANADGILASLIEKDKAEGKPLTPERMIELQKLAITKAKEAADLGPDPTLQAIRELALQRGQTGTLDPKQEFDAVRQLSGDWTKATAGLREMQRQHSLMQVGLKRFRQGDKNGGSQAVLVTFQKILDPTSVVRETEYARSAEGLAFMSRLEGYAERLRAGGAGVPDHELAGMVETARQFVEKMDGFTKGERRRLEKIVGKYQIDPSMVFSETEVPPAEPDAAPTPDDLRKKLGLTMTPSHRQEPR